MPNPAGELKGNLGRILYNNQVLPLTRKTHIQAQAKRKDCQHFQKGTQKDCLNSFMFLCFFYVLLTVCVVVFFSSDILLIYSAV